MHIIRADKGLTGSEKDSAPFVLFAEPRIYIPNPPSLLVCKQIQKCGRILGGMSIILSTSKLKLSWFSNDVTTVRWGLRKWLTWLWVIQQQSSQVSEVWLPGPCLSPSCCSYLFLTYRVERIITPILPGYYFLKLEIGFRFICAFISILWINHKEITLCLMTGLLH